ncbi:MAG: hypothetical protein KJN59_02550, partial [Bacteroidia bacterium]|nr:hypothetical protein [Bacteroidia bacterium]
LVDINEPTDKILNLTPLNSLTEIYSETNTDSLFGSLYVTTSHLLNFNGLDNLTKVSMLRIVENESLTNLDGLSGLSEITGDNSGFNMLQISANQNLNNIDGLENLKHVGKEDYFTKFIIVGNSQLSNIDGFQSLMTIGGPNSQNDSQSPSLSIYYNDSLENLDGLSNLNFVKGYLRFISGSDLIGPNGPEFYGNSNLTDYCGLQNLLMNGIYGGYIWSQYYDGYNPTVQDIIDGNCSQ